MREEESQHRVKNPSTNIVFIKKAASFDGEFTSPPLIIDVAINMI